MVVLGISTGPREVIGGFALLSLGTSDGVVLPVDYSFWSWSGLIDVPFGNGRQWGSPKESFRRLIRCCEDALAASAGG